MTLAMTLRELRKSKNLSQEDLAKAMGMGKNTVARMEKTGAAVKLNVLSKAAQALGVPTWKILRYVSTTNGASKEIGL